MPEIADIMDVDIEDLSPEQRQHLQDAVNQFQQKCLLSFKKNRSGVPYLRNDMPRVLLPGESDATTQQEREECLQAFRDAADLVLSKHHKAFLGAFQQMMVLSSARAWSRHLAKHPSKGAPWSWANQALNHHCGASQFNLLLRALEVKLSSLLRRALGASQFSLHCRPQEDSQSSHHRRAARVNLCNSRIRISPRTET
jgi:hypothetical protein